MLRLMELGAGGVCAVEGLGEAGALFSFLAEDFVGEEDAYGHADGADEEVDAGEVEGGLAAGEVGEGVVHDEGADDGGEAHEAGEGALEFALVGWGDVAGDDGLEGGAADAAEAVGDEEGEHHPGLGCEGEEGEAEGIECEAEIDAFFVAEFGVDDAGEAGLDAADEDADEGEGEADGFGAPVEAIAGEIIPIGLDALCTEVDEEEADGEAADLGMGFEEFEGAEGVGAAPFEGSAFVEGKRFGQEEIAIDAIEQTQCCCGVEGCADAPGRQEGA